MKKLITFLLIAGFAVLSGIIEMEDSVSQANDVVVIVNKARPDLTRDQVKDIFKAKMNRWPDGAELKVLINKDGSSRSAQ